MSLLAQSRIRQQIDGSCRTRMFHRTALELGEDGGAVLARMTYVDESTCIGCKNCALVARNTFSWRSRSPARRASSIRAATRRISSPRPLNRAQSTASTTFPWRICAPWSRSAWRATRTWTLTTTPTSSVLGRVRMPPYPRPRPSTTALSPWAIGATTAPAAGAQCPMFGVGENPIYLKRKQARELKKQQSGEAERERRDREAQRRIDVLYGEGGAAGADGAAAVGTNGEALDSVFDAIFGDGYADPAGGDLIYGDAESAAKERLREELGNDEAIAESLDPYAVLGVKEDASLKEIKRAFRRLAMRWHPDRNARLPEIERLQAEGSSSSRSTLRTRCSPTPPSDASTTREARQAQGRRRLQERLAARMDSGNRRSAQNELDGAKGVVKPVALGSGVSLSELADEEEKDSGIKAPLLLSAVSSGPGRGGRRRGGAGTTAAIRMSSMTTGEAYGVNDGAEHGMKGVGAVPTGAG